jgi:putative transposase
MSIWLTAKECLLLPGLPGREHNIRNKLDKCVEGNSELRRRREGTKAFEYHIDCLPSAAQATLRERHLNAILNDVSKSKKVPAIRSVSGALKVKQELEIMRQCPALLESKLGELTSQQRAIADARMGLVCEVLAIEDAKLSRLKAINMICEQSRSGRLPTHLQAMVDVANARKGKRVGIGSRSLNTWVLDYLRADNSVERLTLLAPGHHKAKKIEDISWLPRFLTYWRDPKGPTMKFCYRKFSKDWQQEYHDQPAMLAVMPSYHAICRAMHKLPPRVLARGRVSGSVARALETYSRRDWSMMPVNGCWICDGKSLDMKVKHPVSKHAFTPELTLIIDGRTRFVVGWSMSYSENVRGVSDAYRHAMQLYGLPLFVYTDNGPGQKNKKLDAETTGIFPRLGVDHMTGIPGNPQARGIIERLNGVIPYAIAQRAPTYNGRGVDRENLRKLMLAVESAEEAQHNGKQLDNRQRKALEAVPEWDVVEAIIQEEIDAYNNTHEHSELPKYKGKYLTPARYRDAVLATEGDDIEYLAEIELREMFMPEETRIVGRGWIQLSNNHYFSDSLSDFDGLEVRVAYDTRNADEVIVRQMDGAFICKAIWNGNTRAAVPVSEIERQIQARTSRQVALLDKKKRKVIEQSTPAIEHKPDFDLGLKLPVREKEEALFFFEEDRNEYLKKTGTEDHK